MHALQATVIGSNGYIGCRLVQHLTRMGWECWTPGRQTHWPVRGRDLGHVFYCAGLTADYLQRPADTVEAHAALLSRVLQSECYSSLVYLSSTRLYDGLPPGSIAREEAAFNVNPCSPRHLYDLTKLVGESLCQRMGFGKARVARLACVYDTGPDATGFLPELLHRLPDLAKGETLQLESSPHFARDYVHVDDVIRALIDIAISGTQPVYNVASGHNLSNAELAQEIEHGSGRKLLFKLSTSPPPPAQVAVDRLAGEFGWYPSTVQAHLKPWLEALT